MGNIIKKRILEEMESEGKRGEDFPFDLIIESATKNNGIVFDGEDGDIIDCAVAYYDAKDMGDKYIMGEERKKLEKILDR